MSNMGYCRFENTLTDLEQCFEALIIGNIESETEKEKAKRMLEKMVYFLYEQDIIENYPDDFGERIRKFIDKL